MRKTVLAVVLTLLTSAACAATSSDAALPTTIDNPRVSVRKVTLAPGGDSITPDPAHPFVVMVVDGGGIRTVEDGKSTVKNFAGGAAFYGAKGTHQTFQAASGHPTLVVVSLKEDVMPPPLPNTSGLPLAFPRPGSKKILENDRVIVWNYSWLPGRATVTHFHDKEVVLVYRKNGTVESTTPHGQVTVNEDHNGLIKFNPSNRIHSEKLLRGQVSAVITELK